MLQEILKEDIVEVPTVARTDPSQIFYIETDWSKDGMGEVLIQVDNSVKARYAEAQERAGEKCEIDNSLEGMRLRPIYFIPISMV